MRSRSGESLVEAAIALILLGAGLIPLAGLAGRSLRMLDEADTIVRADVFAVAVIDSLTQMQRPAGGTRTRAGATAVWTVQPGGGATSRVELIVRYDCPLHAHADTFAAIAGPWPPRLRHAP